MPYHEPMRLITMIEAPLEHARRALEKVATMKNLVFNDWLRLMIVDPDQQKIFIYNKGQWDELTKPDKDATIIEKESCVQ